MSKEAGRLGVGRSLVGPFLLLLFSGLHITVSACDSLDTETSVSTDEAIGVVSTAIPDGTAEDVATDSTSEHGTTLSTTLASVVIAPTSTGVLQASPGLTLEPMSPAVSLDPLVLSTWTRYEEDDPLVYRSGDWDLEQSGLASGGSYLRHTERRTVLCFFEGRGFRLIAYKDSAGGWLRISVGEIYRPYNKMTELVDCYSPTPVTAVVFETPPSLPVARYWVVISAASDTSSSDNIAPPQSPLTPGAIAVDAVEVHSGTLIPFMFDWMDCWNEVEILPDAARP